MIEKRYSQTYIASNWVFYSSVFMRFLYFILVNDIFLSANTEDIPLIDNVISLFSEQNMLQILITFDESIAKPQKKKQVDISVLYSHLSFIEGPTHKYILIFTLENKEKMSSLISLAHEIVTNPDKFSKIMNKNEKQSIFKNHDIIQKLENIIKNLCIMFQIDIKEIQKRHKKLSFIEATKREVKLLKPETISTDTMQLTDRGKYQLIMGYRKSNPRDVQYIGDYLHRPITTLEVPHLTEGAIWISDKLNEYFQTKSINLRFFTSYFSVMIFGVVSIILIFLRLFIRLIFKI